MVKVTIRHSANMAALHQHAGVTIKKLMKMFPQYGQASIYRHAKREITAEPPIDRRKNDKGRPSKLTDCERRNIVASIKKLRKSSGHFTSSRVGLKCGVSTKVCNRSVRRVLNQAGYGYRQSRKKGLLGEDDCVARVNFCEKIKKNGLGQEFWNQYISFDLDAKGFEFKTNPLDQARAPRAREWRLKNEGLVVTAKGKKEGSTNINFMVGISFDKGVVLCEQYKGAINGDKMVKIVESSFEDAFDKSIAPRAKRFLTDRCPRQTCKKAMQAYDRINAKVFKIPSRSPDLNPIENFFNLVSRALKKQALEQKINKETLEEFSARVEKCMCEFPITTINNIIGSMDKRINMVLQSGGRRIKY